MKATQLHHRIEKKTLMLMAKEKKKTLEAQQAN
jgi:hypothetical protein